MARSREFARKRCEASVHVVPHDEGGKLGDLSSENDVKRGLERSVEDSVHTSSVSRTLDDPYECRNGCTKWGRQRLAGGNRGTPKNEWAHPFEKRLDPGERQPPPKRREIFRTDRLDLM